MLVFTNASHLSRTFRRMFGLTPSDVAGSVEWIVAEDKGPPPT